MIEQSDDKRVITNRNKFYETSSTKKKAAPRDGLFNYQHYLLHIIITHDLSSTECGEFGGCHHVINHSIGTIEK